MAASFSAGFAGTLITPRDAAYDESRAVWNGIVDRRPAVIARCHETADIIAAVNLARIARAPLAVRGGGHSIPGYSSCDGGVVVDCSAMRRVAVDPDAGTAVAEPGARWSDVDAATAEYGLATTFEPVAMGQTTTLAASQNLIRASGADVGLLYDLWHFVRAGQTAADLG